MNTYYWVPSRAKDWLTRRRSLTTDEAALLMSLASLRPHDENASSTEVFVRLLCTLQTDKFTANYINFTQQLLITSQQLGWQILLRCRVRTVTFQLNCTVFPSVLWHCWLGDRKGIWPVKSWVLVTWWGRFDWSFPRCTAPVFNIC